MKKKCQVLNELYEHFLINFQLKSIQLFSFIMKKKKANNLILNLRKSNIKMIDEIK